MFGCAPAVAGGGTKMSTPPADCPGASDTTVGGTTAPPVAAGLLAGGAALADFPPQPVTSHTLKQKQIRTNGTRKKRTSRNTVKRCLRAEQMLSRSTAGFSV